MMENALMTFEYQQHEVRTIIGEDGVMLWVAKDVCEALGIVKYRDVFERLDDDQRVSIKVDTLGGEQEMIAVNESGLYKLIFRSNKPEAKAFRKWVTFDVLPSIRKTGEYHLPADIQQRLRELTAAIAQKDERIQALEGETQMKNNMLSGQRQLTDILCHVVGEHGGKRVTSAQRQQQARERRRIVRGVTAARRARIETLYEQGYAAEDIAAETAVSMDVAAAVMRDLDERTLRTMRAAKRQAQLAQQAAQ